MSNHGPQSTPPIPQAIARQAATWLARRDRGLTPAEQDDYMQWLMADPRHAEAMSQQAAAFGRMMQLGEWQPADTTDPNPDLFAAPRRRQRRRWIAGLSAAAAAVAAVFLFGPMAPRPPPAMAPAKSYLRVNERLALPDGSRVELKDGSKVVVQYSATERGVKLTGGEAHFTVWKDASRPFVVEAGGVRVRAVGTAFVVRLQPAEVEVLVTEGRVKVEARAAPTESLPVPGREQAMMELAAGQRTTVTLTAPEAPPPPAPVVAPVTPEEINRALAWQAPRLQFDETPLADAVAEFNRLNRQQIVLADSKLGTLLIGGTFRPDNVEGFVRLLAATHGLAAGQDAAGRTVLRWSR